MKLCVCSVCKGVNIQITAWVDANTGADCGGDSPTEQVWCEDCDEETGIEVLDVTEAKRTKRLVGRPIRLEDRL